MTFHYLDNDFKLKRFVVGMLHFVDEHTSRALQTILETSLKRVSGLNVDVTHIVSVTDNAANIMRAVRQSTIINEHVGCAAHTLQLVVRDCLRNVEYINNILAQCQELSNLTHRSGKQQNKIREMCLQIEADPEQTLSWPYRKIICPNATRWDSMFMCVQSILALEEPLLQLKQSDRDFDCVPTEEEFLSMQELVVLLGRFQITTQALCAEETPTAHLVIVMLYNLGEELRKKKDSAKCPHVKQWAEGAHKELFRRFPTYGCESKVWAMGHFFHPYYKGLVMWKLKKEMMDIWIQELIDEEVICFNCGTQYLKPGFTPHPPHPPLGLTIFNTKWVQIKKTSKEFDFIILFFLMKGKQVHENKLLKNLTKKRYF